MYNVTSVLSTLFLHWQLASDVLQTMDNQIDSCVDFYKFACGNYDKRVNLTEDKTRMEPMMEISDGVAKQLREILESPDQASDFKSALLAKQFYRSCINVSALEKLGLQPLFDKINDLGGWPVLEQEKWNENEYDWIATEIKLFSNFNANGLFRLRFYPDSRNSSANMLNIDQPDMNLDKRDYYLDPTHLKILNAYRNFIRATALQLGANNATVDSELDDVINFEIALANISKSQEDRRDLEELYHPMTISQLKETFPELHVEKWFQHLENNNLRLSDTEIVDVLGFPYLEQLNNILGNFSNRTLANYQVWNLVNTLIQYLAPSLREHYREYHQALTGAKKIKPRWEECVEEITDSMTWPVGALFVKNYFKGNAKQEIEQILVDIRASMKHTIEVADWMDVQTKMHAQEKLSGMLQKIAYPHDIYNDTWLLRRYQEVNLTKDNYLSNTASVIKSIMRSGIRDFYLPINRSEWDASPAEVNAYYSPSFNEIRFPAGILQYPLYAPYLSFYMKYSRIGSIIGHKFTHGYDDQGRQYDASGNLVSWWTNETLAKFKNENTVGENIADNGGLKLAYKAYQLWKNRTHSQNKNGQKYEEPKVPGLHNYTIDQLFFLSYGQTWCIVARQEWMQNFILTNEHSPNDARINVPLQNYDKFANAYNCPFGKSDESRRKM